MPSLPARPWLNSYWVLPGRLLAGEYPAVIDAAATRERIARLAAIGIDCIIDLTAPEEAPPYDDLLPAEVAHHRLSIRDHGIPADPAHMADILEVIESALRGGRRVYVHCRAGIGRTGTVVGCLLVERGATGDQALDALNAAWQQCARAESWPSVPETEEQIEYVRSWQPRVMLGAAAESELAPAHAGAGPVTIRGRFRGALVGLAAADALAAATQQRAPGALASAAGPPGGEPIDLPPGAWTDDTAMALCLADSLIACRAFDARDQVERYVRWQQDGYLSATDRCVGITPSTARALAVAQWRRQVFPGSHEPKQLDPEPLSRVAPVVMFAFADVEEAARLAGDAARITCQAPSVVEVCRVFAAMVHAALCGAPKEEVLAPTRGLEALEAAGLRPRLRSLLRGRYRHKRAEQIRAGDTILEVLEAALWAFDHSETFGDGALLAAGFAGNADVAAAAYGQLAGAFYGEPAIPPPWRTALLKRDVIEALAEELFTSAFGTPT